MHLLINSLTLLHCASTSQMAFRVHQPSPPQFAGKWENKSMELHFPCSPTLEHGCLAEPLLLLLLEQLVAGAWAGQEQPESLWGRTSSGTALGVPSELFPLPGSITFRSGAGTKLRNSSTCPTWSQSEKSSTGACTFWATRKSRTALAILRPPSLGEHGGLGGREILFVGFSCSCPAWESTGVWEGWEILFWGFPAPGSPGEAAADQDAPQGVLLALHRHRWAHLQISKGIQGGSAFWSLPGHVAKIRALDGGKTRGNGLKKCSRWH